jgi:hypothetical protein
MPSFIEAHNGKFAEVPRNPHDAHRPLRPEEDLDLIFAWRELRKVSQNLLLHYERKLYVLVDTPDNRRLIGKYVEVFQYPDGRIEIRVAGRALPYSLYINSGTIRFPILFAHPCADSHRLRRLGWMTDLAASGTGKFRQGPVRSADRTGRTRTAARTTAAAACGSRALA